MLTMFGVGRARFFVLSITLFYLLKRAVQPCDMVGYVLPTLLPLLLAISYIFITGVYCYFLLVVLKSTFYVVGGRASYEIILFVTI